MDGLYRVLYRDLYARAIRCMEGQAANHTLQATALVNEAYLRLSAAPKAGFQDCKHFLSTASKAMRHILVDHARRKKTRKRDALPEDVPLDQLVDSFEECAQDLESLDEALHHLAGFDPLMATAVDLRFFGGIDPCSIAPMLGMTRRTFDRRWQSTRAWLRSRVK